MRSIFTGRLAQALALIVLFLGFTVFSGWVSPAPAQVDFNIYYYASVAQQTTSYMDTKVALSLAAQAKDQATLGGAWGTPALVALLFYPLTLVSQEHAWLIWQVITFALVVLGVRKAAGERWPIFLTISALSPAFLLGVHVGNVSVIVLALLAYAFGCLRDDQQNGVGVALGVATAFKMYPGFLTLVLLAKRKWRAVGTTILAFGVATALAVPVLGARVFCNGTLQLIDVSQFGGKIWDNVSIPGLMSWLFGTSVGSVANLFLLIVSALAIFKLRKLPVVILFAIAINLMLLSQSLSWNHYFSFALLALIALFTTTKSATCRIVALISYAGAVIVSSADGVLSFLPMVANTFGMTALTAVLLISSFRTTNLTTS